MAKRRHLRLGDSLDDDIIRPDAARYHDVYGVLGVSVFAARRNQRHFTLGFEDLDAPVYGGSPSVSTSDGTTRTMRTRTSAGSPDGHRHS